MEFSYFSCRNQWSLKEVDKILIFKILDTKFKLDQIWEGRISREYVMQEMMYNNYDNETIPNGTEIVKWSQSVLVILPTPVENSPRYALLPQVNNYLILNENLTFLQILSIFNFFAIAFLDFVISAPKPTRIWRSFRYTSRISPRLCLLR